MSDPEILIAMSLSRASTAQRLRAVEVAFHYAVGCGIDAIKVEPAFMESPPDSLADQLTEWIEAGTRQRRWVVFQLPSQDVIALALAASPYVVSINLLRNGRELVSVSDAADALDLEMPRAEWDRVRPELVGILGESLRYDMAELARSDNV